MRMRPDVEAFAEMELGRAHLVEEDEGADHALADGGQRPADLKATEVMGAGDDHLLDRLAGAGIAQDRVVGGELRHEGLLGRG